MTKTTNYQLNQWAASDRVLREDFNSDNAKIESALSAKAEASDVTSLAAALNTKASAADLSTLSASQLKLKIGNYVGTGTYGAANPVTLTFDFTPKYVKVIAAPNNVGGVYYALEAIRGQTSVTVYGGYSSASYQSAAQLTWGERSLSWYNTASDAYAQNNANYTYYYIAIG